MRSSRSSLDRLQDILDAIARIDRFTAGQSFAEFAADEKGVYAVRSNFGIIGEAARALPQELRARYPEVEWKRAGDMRNFVVHVYWAIDDEVVWKTIQEDLPILKQQVEAILAEGDDA